MGYKLAGFNVLGGVEIDHEMMKIYRANHNPKHSFLMGVGDFNKLPKEKIPAELFDLDILDGSPPCSSFSMAGSREKAWGKKKKFREGQSEQVLDDLFFQFIETARILQPKVVIAENVRGLIMGNARGYVKQIFQMFRHAGYSSQLFLLNSAAMGVPQSRERTFFVSTRNDLGFPKIDLKFSENQITVGEAIRGISPSFSPLSGKSLDRWNKTKPGNYAMSESGKTFGFMSKESQHKPCTTVTASVRNYHWEEPRPLSGLEIVRIQTFPDDFDFKDSRQQYVCGMSVPPFMMQRIAREVHRQWFLKSET